VNWVLQINIQSIMDQLIDKSLVGPMIVVMPSIDPHHSFQDCVDAPGALDDTYISQDVAADVRTRYRASLVPAEWGIGGYSSGGYCAANLVLRHRSAYGAAGIMDGYFRPIDGPAAAALHGDARLEGQNDPLAAVQRLTRGAEPLPAFWISAGTASAKYNLGARNFVKALNGIIGVTFTSEPGAGHNFYTWRPAIPRMLGWMWQQIAPPALRVHFPVVGPVNNSVLVAPKSPPPTGPPSGSRSSTSRKRHPSTPATNSPTATARP
jgi:S-formylglutathione hydrolase FrmB